MRNQDKNLISKKEYILILNFLKILNEKIEMSIHSVEKSFNNFLLK